MRCTAALLFACCALLWGGTEALVECTSNSCYSSCAAKIAERNSGRCVSGSTQQDLCSCSVQEWQCTAQCGCFQRAVCDGQQADWGSRCALNCAQLANVPGATSGAPGYGFLSFDSTDTTYYILDILFVLLCILLACCCCGLLISCCLVAYSLFTGKRRQVMYTDAAGRPISSPRSSRYSRSSPGSFIGSPLASPAGAYPYTAAVGAFPFGGGVPATATSVPYATAQQFGVPYATAQQVGIPYATATHQMVPMTYTTITSPGHITPTQIAIGSPVHHYPTIGSPLHQPYPAMGSPVHHAYPTQGIPLELGRAMARTESQLLHSPFASPHTTTVKTTRTLL